MGTLGRLLGFEVRFAARRASTWVYAAVCFAIGFLLINAAGGAFRSVTVATADHEFANSPASVAMWITLVGMLGTVAVGAIVGGAAARDFEERMDVLVLTTPVSKSAYLAGRFLGSTLVVALVFLAIPLGIAVGSAMPYLERDRFGPFLLAAYWRPFVMLVAPNLVLTATIFFTVGTLARRAFANHVGAVVLVVAYLVAAQLAGDLETRALAALLDPFGLAPLSLTLRYWSIVERNTRVIPLTGPLLANRVLWLGVAVGLWAWLWARFRVAQDLSSGAWRHARDVEPPAATGRVLLPARVRQEFSPGTSWAQFRRMARQELTGLVRSRSFALVAACGIVLLLVLAPEATKIYGTPTYPVTYSILDTLGAGWSPFLWVVLTIYAGELVWRDRDVGIDGVMDTVPVAVAVRYAAKFAALLGLVVILLAALLACGVATQAAQGYYRFELPLYVEQLFGIYLVDAAISASLVFMVHVLVNQKYLGHAAVGLLLAVRNYLPNVGLEHSLYSYGADSGVMYSDMNGYGASLGPWGWWKLYWGALAVLFAVAIVLFWVRGPEAAWRRRWAAARQRLTGTTRRVAAGGAVVWVLAGGWLFYNTNIVDEFVPSRVAERRAADYERAYRRFAHAPQPRIVAVSVRADLFPAAGEVAFRGRTTVKNTTAVTIDSVHVMLPAERHLQVRRLGFSSPAKLVLNDPRWGYRIFRLVHPLLPGDSIDLDFDLTYHARGFTHAPGVYRNGSFVHSDLLPRIGYDPGQELNDEAARRHQHLPFKRRMPDLYDTLARRNSYVSNDADWIRFDAVVTTDSDQVAIAPGRLVREWRQGSRRLFRYVNDSPALNAYAFLSGRYAVMRDRWNNVAVEILYHPAHAFNVRRIDDAVKKSLAYYSAAFGPYPHDVLRIVEFPRYASFAQAFPTTIPYSESIGFLARFDPKTSIDYPFYVAAHEVAHQWWAHQVIGGDVQGAAMLSETLSQYAALMVMEQEYGRFAMRRFLAYELDNYLAGRGAEAEAEQPLYRVEGASYVYYRKGSVVMYGLRDLLGKDAVNAVLAGYVKAKRFQSPPFTFTPELIDALRAITPDSLAYVLSDFLEKITLYDNRAVRASARPLGGGRYAVDFTVRGQKFYADTLGRSTPAPMNDYVDIAVYGPAPAAGGDRVPLYSAKHRLAPGERTFRVTVAGLPVTAGIDPDHKLVDLHPDDNMTDVTVTRGPGPSP